MTERQTELLEFIRTYQLEHRGVSPSFVEMQAALGLQAKSGVHRLLLELERAGKIRRTKGVVRSIVIIGPMQASAMTDAELLIARRSLTLEAVRRGLVQAEA